MTNRKKPVIAPRSDEINRYLVSAGGVAASPSETNPCSNPDPETGIKVQQLDGGVDAVAHVTEQRKARRFPVCSPATIRWLGSDGKVHEALGIVRDISTCGLFVEAEHSLRTNMNVELEITPFGMQSDRPKTELHFEGKIVRTERGERRRGFAVAGFLWLAKLGLRIT